MISKINAAIKIKIKESTSYNNIINIYLVYFFMIANLVLSRDTLITTSLLGFYRAQILMIIISILVIIIYFSNNRFELKNIINSTRIKILLFFIISTLTSMVIKRDFTLMYLSICFAVFNATILCFVSNKEQLFRTFVNIMIFLSACSLFSMYLLKPMNVLPSTFTNISNFEFYNYIFSYVPTKIGYLRNFGIFREPGVYQFFLVLSIYITLFQLKGIKFRKIYLIVFVITLCTTFSTNGIIEMALIYLAWALIQKDFIKNYYKIILIVIIGLFTLIFCFMKINSDFYWVMYEMISKLFKANDSLSARLESIFFNITVIAKNPLFGGLVSNIMYTVEHNTSSTLLLFGITGVFGGLFHLITWMLFIITERGKNLSTLLVIIALFMSFNTQNIITNMYFWIFPMIFLDGFLLEKRSEYSYENNVGN